MTQTGPQIMISWGPDLEQPLPESYNTYRAMRKHPTIALGRALAIAPILAGSWSLEASEDASDEAVELIEYDLIPMRELFLEAALLGGIDFGRQAFEKVFEYKDERYHLTKLKPLLPDLTTILVDEKTGAFAGFKQTVPREVILPIANSLLISFRVEGTQWHGQSLLENARATFNAWTAANTGAALYDDKVAGSHFVVEYPPGTSMVAGAEKPNNEIAQGIAQSLKSSGGIVIPNTIAKYAEDLNKETPGWHIYFLEDKSGRQATFIARLKYLDVQLVRSMLLPERTVLEGQFGTKAEAGVHTDLALTNMALLDAHVARHLNWYVVDQLLAVNFGEETRGSVRIVPAPLADEKLAFLREIYKAVLTNPQGFMEEQDAVDWRAMRETLGIPEDEGDDDDTTDAGDGAAPTPAMTDDDMQKFIDQETET